MNEDIQVKLAELRNQIAQGNADAVQSAVFALGSGETGHWRAVPDEAVEGILAILSDSQMYASHLAGHLLNFFEFESRFLSKAQKRRCLAFLEEHGDRFTDVHAVQVVTELRFDSFGNWLH